MGGEELMALVWKFYNTVIISMVVFDIGESEIL